MDRMNVNNVWKIEDFESFQMSPRLFLYDFNFIKILS